MEKNGVRYDFLWALKKAHKKSYFVQSIGKHFFIPKEYEGKKVFLILMEFTEIHIFVSMNLESFLGHPTEIQRTILREKPVL